MHGIFLTISPTGPVRLGEQTWFPDFNVESRPFRAPAGREHLYAQRYLQYSRHGVEPILLTTWNYYQHAEPSTLVRQGMYLLT
jgi:hypothetical protein